MLDFTKFENFLERKPFTKNKKSPILKLGKYLFATNPKIGKIENSQFYFILGLIFSSFNHLKKQRQSQVTL